jgi:hypothetical protein
VGASTIGFWLAVCGAGGGVYVSQVLLHWAPAAWSGPVTLVAVVLVACGVVLSASGAEPAEGPAFLPASAAVAAFVAIRLTHADVRHDVLVDAICVLVTAWATVRLRGRRPERVGSLLAWIGIATFAGEQLYGGVPPHWHERLVSAATALVILGIAVSVGARLAGGEFEASFAVALAWAVALSGASRQWRGPLHLTEHWIRALDIGGAVLIAAALLSATALAVRSAAVLTVGPAQVDDYLLFSFTGWAGVAVAVASLLTIGSFALPGPIPIVLVALAAIGIIVAFTSLWSAVVVTPDPAYAAEPWADRSVTELGRLVVRGVLRGPRDMGEGPFFGVCGVILVAVFEAAPSWDPVAFFRTVGAVLFIGGSTRTAVVVMRRLRAQAAAAADADAETDDASERQMRLALMSRQAGLVPVAVACGLTAMWLLFVIGSAGIATALRGALVVVVVAGLLVPAVPIALGLIGPSLQRAQLEWWELPDDDSLGGPALGIVAGLVVSVTAFVLASSFDLFGGLELVLWAAAAAGFAATLWAAARLQTRLTRVGAADLVRRVQHLGTSGRAVHRLLLVTATDDGARDS